MSAGAMVLSRVAGAFSVSSKEFVQHLTDRWPDAVVLTRVDVNEITDVTARITPAWQIFHNRAGDQLRTDGDYEQQLEFAAWVTRSFVHDRGPVWLLNKEATIVANLRQHDP